MFPVFASLFSIEWRQTERWFSQQNPSCVEAHHRESSLKIELASWLVAKGEATARIIHIEEELEATEIEKHKYKESTE